MKNSTKQILMNLGILGVAGVMIGPFGILSSVELAVVGIGALVGTALAGNIMFTSMEDTKIKEIPVKDKSIITEEDFNKLNTADDYANMLTNLYKYTADAEKIYNDWQAFQKKKLTLDTLTVDNGSYDFVTADVESTIVSNMKSFIKRMAIIQSENNSELLKSHYKYLSNLASNVHNIVADYTRLLVEVSQLKDGQFDSDEKQVESLNNLIESIKYYRDTSQK